MCKASLFFKLNLELALSIILKERELQLTPDKWNLQGTEEYGST